MSKEMELKQASERLAQVMGKVAEPERQVQRRRNDIKDMTYKEYVMLIDALRQESRRIEK